VLSIVHVDATSTRHRRRRPLRVKCVRRDAESSAMASMRQAANYGTGLRSLTSIHRHFSSTRTQNIGLTCSLSTGHFSLPIALRFGGGLGRPLSSRQCRSGRHIAVDVITLQTFKGRIFHFLPKNKCSE